MTQPHGSPLSTQGSSTLTSLQWFNAFWFSGLLLATPLTTWADNAPQWQSIPDQTTAQTTQQQVWLGVGLTEIPSALRAQLAQLMPDQQGVLVNKITPNSPAAKAGLQVNDIILSFNGTHIQSANQLARLVQESNVNRTIDMDIIHRGKLVNRTATLSARSNTNNNTFSSPFWQALPNLSQTFPQQKQSSAWDEFQSVQINSLANGRYRAEIHYKNQQNQDKRFTFEGTREEITQQIQQQNDLPQEKKQALLNAFTMQPNQLSELNQFFNGFSGFSDHFGKQGLNEPLLQSNPFDHPFFQRNFQKELQNELSPFLNQLKQEFEQYRSPSNQSPQPSPSRPTNTITL